jgi:predicted PurR-regulated permease PerM
LTPKIQLSGCLGALLGAAALIGVVYGLQAARSIVVPFLLATFLALVFTGPMLWLERKGMPAGLAVVVIVIAILALLGSVGALLGTSAQEFSANLPTYQQRLQQDLGSLVEALRERGVPISSEEVMGMVDPGAALGFAGSLLSGVSGAMGNSFLILFTLIFMLLEASYFSDKARLAFGGSTETMDALGRFHTSLNQYLGLKSVISLATGLVIWIFLAILGVDFALIFGLLAFLLNFIPNIGSIIAAVPAVLIAYLQLGVGNALIVAVGFVVVNVVMGSIIEPRVMGEGMGISALVVFVSLVFWGWVFGTVGMLLSVPLTMSVKIALESRDETRQFAILLGPKPDESEPDAAAA